MINNPVDKAKQAVATAPKMITVYDFFDSQKELIRKALPKTITPDRMVSLFTMAIKSSPEIMSWIDFDRWDFSLTLDMLGQDIQLPRLIVVFFYFASLLLSNIIIHPHIVVIQTL